jgi:hypothetical protein
MAGVAACAAPADGADVERTTEALYAGAALARCQWTNVVALDLACSGVLLAPDLVVYAAHCGTTFTRVWSSSQEVGVRDCHALPGAALGGTDIAYCRLARSFSAAIVPPATGCEDSAVQPGTSVVMVGYGIDSPDGQFGIRRASAGVISSVAGDEIVVGGLSAGICPGDSGGALLAEVPDPASASGLSYRVVGIASASPAGPCRPSDSHYARIAPRLAWLEEQSGFDLTPCGSAQGDWAPTPDCVAPQFDAAAACTAALLPGPSGTCGPPFAPMPLDTTLPRAAVTRPLPGELFLRPPAAAVPIAISAEDDGWGVQSVSVDLLDAAATVVWSDHRSLAPYDFEAAGLAPSGRYTVRAQVTDYAGNSVTTTADFQVRDAGSGCALGPGGAAGGSGALLLAACVLVAAATSRRSSAPRSR